MFLKEKYISISYLFHYCNKIFDKSSLRKGFHFIQHSLSRWGRWGGRTKRLGTLSLQSELLTLSLQSELSTLSLQSELRTLSLQSELGTLSLQSELSTLSLQSELRAPSACAQMLSPSELLRRIPWNGWTHIDPYFNSPIQKNPESQGRDLFPWWF
jgi:hypothetical protein